MLEWSFIPPWADEADNVPNPINAHMETTHEKALSRGIYGSLQSLILADDFYEWGVNETISSRTGSNLRIESRMPIPSSGKAGRKQTIMRSESPARF